MIRRKRGETSLFTLKLLVFLGANFFVAEVFANPVLNNISAGNVSIQQVPHSTVINQSSQKAIINWKSFNINAQESTHFNQPAGGVALNRISPQQGASQIYGRLTATGQIILVNPAGIYFGPSAYVNVGGLIATTANISDQNFLNGHYVFDQASPFADASIINAGTIIAAQQGLIALVGSNVTNNGLIQANFGHVVLASGNAFTMSFAGNDMVHFALTQSAAKSGKVTNTGSLIANGGQILVTAKQASAVLDNVINLKGIVQAKSVYEKNGEIIISGDPHGGVVNVAANIDASGTKGGNITITGHDIFIDSPTIINASGNVAGGNIYIGGNYQGKGVLPNANAVVMMKGAAIYADAITNGNGGNVILWSDNATKVYGDIYARGGQMGGNGGFVETSGKNYLDVNGITVNTSAAQGLNGSWLLDPTNIWIASSLASANAAGMPGNDTSADSSGPLIFEASGATDDSLLLVGTLEAALANNSVEVRTTNPGGVAAGDITVVDALSWLTSNSLTLTADHNISIQGQISTGLGSMLILNAVNNVTQSGAGIIAGDGGVQKLGAGTFTASLLNTYTGQTIISNGTLTANTLADGGTASSIGASPATTPVIIGSATQGTLSYSNPNGFSVGSSNRQFTVGGSGGGVIAINGAAQLVLSGNIDNGGNLLTLSTNTSNLTSNGVISGTGGLNNTTTSGTLVLGGTNTFSGPITISYAQLSNTSALGNSSLPQGAGAITVTPGGGSLILGLAGTLLNTSDITINGFGSNATLGGAIFGSGTLNNNVILAGNSAISSTFDLTIKGGISGGFNLTIQGNQRATLAGTNSYTGTTTIFSGTLRIGDGGALTTGTFGAGNVINNSALIFNRATPYTVNNAISGTGTLTQAGSSTITLSGANSYTGATNINSGTLAAGNALALGTAASGTSVNGGALTINNGITIANEAITLNNGTLNGIGNAEVDSAITLTASTSNTMTSTGNFILNGAINGNASLNLQGAGTFTLGSNIGSGTSLSSLTSSSDLILLPVVGLTTNLSANTISLNNNVNGGGFNLALNGRTLSLVGSVNLQDLSFNGTNATSNTFTLDTNSAQIWNIATSNSGTMTATGINGTGSFTSVANSLLNLSGGSAADDFIFADGVAVGNINGGNTSTANTLDYTAYLTPITIALGSPVSQGSTYINYNTTPQSITSFANIFNIAANSANNNSLIVPSGSSISPSGPTSGTVDGILTWSGLIPNTPSPTPAPTTTTTTSSDLNSFTSGILQQPDSLNSSSSQVTWVTQGEVVQNINDLFAQVKALYDADLSKIKINPYCN